MMVHTEKLSRTYLKNPTKPGTPNLSGIFIIYAHSIVYQG